jgi:hypothetical protein
VLFHRAAQKWVLQMPQNCHIFAMGRKTSDTFTSANAVAGWILQIFNNLETNGGRAIVRL